jgi:hypothetical protein
VRRPRTSRPRAPYRKVSPPRPARAAGTFSPAASSAAAHGAHRELRARRVQTLTEISQSALAASRAFGADPTAITRSLRLMAPPPGSPGATPLASVDLVAQIREEAARLGVDADLAVAAAREVAGRYGWGGN